MASSINTPPSQFLGILVRQIPVIPLVQDTIRKGATRPNGEDVSFQPRPIGIDVVYLWTLCVFVCQQEPVWHRKASPTVLSQPQIIVPYNILRPFPAHEGWLRTILKPIPLYPYTRLLRYLLAAATEIRSLFLSS